VFGEGLMEYEALLAQAGQGPKLGLTLLRCVGYLSREDLTSRPSGHAGPGLPTPGAQCLGRHQFRLAFEPRRVPPTGAALFARAASFVAPPHVVQAQGAGGTMLPADAFIKLEPGRGGAVLSACCKAADRDSLILRFFNPDEVPATMRVSARRRVEKAFRVNFLEERQDELQLRDGVVDLHVGPHQICTIELVSV
jgi:alpha-mannosidase